jgi:hypothetical protein
MLAKTGNRQRKILFSPALAISYAFWNLELSKPALPSRARALLFLNKK